MKKIIFALSILMAVAVVNAPLKALEVNSISVVTGDGDDDKKECSKKKKCKGKKACKGKKDCKGKKECTDKKDCAEKK